MSKFHYEDYGQYYIFDIDDIYSISDTIKVEVDNCDRPISYFIVKIWERIEISSKKLSTIKIYLEVDDRGVIDNKLWVELKGWFDNERI